MGFLSDAVRMRVARGDSGLLTLLRLGYFKILQGIPMAFRMQLSFISLAEKSHSGFDFMLSASQEVSRELLQLGGATCKCYLLPGDFSLLAFFFFL